MFRHKIPLKSINLLIIYVYIDQYMWLFTEIQPYLIIYCNLIILTVDLVEEIETYS